MNGKFNKHRDEAYLQCAIDSIVFAEIIIILITLLHLNMYMYTVHCTLKINMSIFKDEA